MNVCINESKISSVNSAKKCFDCTNEALYKKANSSDDNEYDKNRFLEILDVLIEEFDSRFIDFKQHDLSFRFIRNPFNFDVTKIGELAKSLGLKETSLAFDLKLLENESRLKNETVETFWNRMLNEHAFLELQKVIPKFASMFGSTYVCESNFSSLARRKNKYRNRLLQECLESEIRCELLDGSLDFLEMSKAKQCQISH